MSETSFANISSPPLGGHQRRRRDGRAAALMMAPNMILFTIFVFVPIIGGILLSFAQWNISVGPPKGVGFANYRGLFADPLVGQAVEATLKFVQPVIISLGPAMLINVKFHFVGLVRTFYLIPAAMSFAASALVWRYLFQAGPGFGVVDYVIHLFGVNNQPDWLGGSTTWALPGLDIITIWLSLPTATILYLAALQRIPDSILEAATLDGAGPWRRVRYIIWPGVRYMTVLVAIVALLAFTNGSFDLVQILTKGGPIYSTQTLIYYIYDQAFDFGNYGYAAALSVLQIALIGGILVMLRLLSKLASR